MIEDDKLGLKVAENSDELFWTNKKNEVVTAIAEEERNKKILDKMLELCNEQLKCT
ncbi:MAG: hypothetical protein WC479_09965 [Candidatus Izemoplasmatales bacterium]|jgi:hypothetical protein